MMRGAPTLPWRPDLPIAQDRRGFVLVTALMATVLIGALAAGVVFATTEDTKVGRTAVARDIALMGTESAIATKISDPTTALPGSVGPAGTMSYQVGDPGSRVIVYITRLDSAMYWIVAEAIPDTVHSGATSRIGVVVNAVKNDDASTTINPIFQRAWSELF